MIFAPHWRRPDPEHDERGPVPCWCAACQRRDREMLASLFASRQPPPQTTNEGQPA